MKDKPRLIPVLRWIARIWSALIALVALLIVFVPGEETSGSAVVPLVEWIGLGSYGLAALGLLIAWRWERVGGIVALTGVLFHDVLFYITKGFQLGYVIGNVIVAVFFLAPAAIFLLCWWFTKQKKAAPAAPAT